MIGKNADSHKDESCRRLPLALSRACPSGWQVATVVLSLCLAAVLLSGQVTPQATPSAKESPGSSLCLLKSRDGTPCVGVELDEHGQPQLWLKSAAGAKIGFGFDKGGSPAIKLVDNQGHEALSATVTEDGGASLELRQSGSKPFARIGEVNAKEGPVFQLYDADGKPFVAYVPKSKQTRDFLFLDPMGKARISLSVPESLDEGEYFAAIHLYDKEFHSLASIGTNAVSVRMLGGWETIMTAKGVVETRPSKPDH